MERAHQVKIVYSRVSPFAAKDYQGFLQPMFHHCLAGFHDQKLILSNWERREKTLIQQLFPFHRHFTFTNDDMEVMLCTALMAFTKPCFRGSVLLLRCQSIKATLTLTEKTKTYGYFASKMLILIK